jgi:Alba
VSRKSKINTLITQSEQALNSEKKLTILGCDETLSKAITVAEILKRNYQ